MKLKEKLRTTRFRIIYLAILVVLIKMFSLFPHTVEDEYSSGFFKIFSIFLRGITGWLSFSLGDILYLLGGIWLLYKALQFISSLFKKRLTLKSVGTSLTKVFITGLIIYIIFNIFWGLNYNRKGIAYRLRLNEERYDTYDLKSIQWLLLQKVNESKAVLLKNKTVYPGNNELFKRAVACYQETQKLYAFINYKPSSVKSSLYGIWGNYLGFTGYYNPFTGEAQVNTTVPKFLLPYTTTHEMAHQLGYAKEDEANFVGYLAASSSNDTLFHYSTYLDLFLYANRAVYFIDSTQAKLAATQLLPEIKADIKEFRDFLKRYRNPLDPVITWLYGKYLKANQQPKGMATYNEVIGNLIAFYKKYGRI